MTLKNTISASSNVGRPSVMSNKYFKYTLDATSSTDIEDPLAAVAGAQHALYGIIISNTHASQTCSVTVSSVNDAILSNIKVLPGDTVSILAPPGFGPLALCETNEGMRLAAIGGSGGTCEVLIMTRTHEE